MDKVEKEYQEFWKDIVENKDGTLNKEQVKKELYDFSMVINHCTKAYSTMTDNEISKPTTKFYEVLTIFHEKYLNFDIVKSDVEDMINTCETLEEIVCELKKFFGIYEEV